MCTASITRARCEAVHALMPLPQTAPKLWALGELERISRWCSLTEAASRGLWDRSVVEQMSSWRELWVDMNVEECLLTEQEEWAIVGNFQEGGVEGIEERLRQEQPQILWLRADGWPQSSAESHSLLSTYCNTAIGAAMASRSPRFAASTLALCGGLTAAALRMQAVAPPVYFNLHGFGGLETQDSVWGILRRRPGRRPRPIFTTCVAGGNIADDRTFPVAPDGETCAGFHKPTVVDGHIEYQLQNSAIVCFRSRDRDAVGTLRTLVPTCATHVYDGSTEDAGETVYDLPPLTEVRRVEVLEPGTWRAHGALVQVRCYVVEVAWGPQLAVPD
jgi:hypothetical protein